jgi:hypothetical protein
MESVIRRIRDLAVKDGSKRNRRVNIHYNTSLGIQKDV